MPQDIMTENRFTNSSLATRLWIMPQLVLWQSIDSQIQFYMCKIKRHVIITGVQYIISDYKLSLVGWENSLHTDTRLRCYTHSVSYRQGRCLSGHPVTPTQTTRTKEQVYYYLIMQNDNKCGRKTHQKSPEASCTHPHCLTDSQHATQRQWEAISQCADLQVKAAQDGAKHTRFVSSAALPNKLSTVRCEV